MEHLSREIWRNCRENSILGCHGITEVRPFELQDEIACTKPTKRSAPQSVDIASKHAHEVVSDSAPPVVNDDPIRDPTSTGIMTRSMTVAQSDDIEQLRTESPLHDSFPADASPLNPLADTFSMLLTPVIDTPVIISTDSVVSVSDVDNIPDSPVLDLTECDSCSDVSCTTDPGATDVGNCAMYFCEYGCGVPDQIVSNDGIYYCRKCKFTMCNRCIDGGGHSRHRKYLVVDSSR